MRKIAAVILTLLMLCSCSAMDNNPQASNSDKLPREIVMPEDNPPPVTIDRADAATPTLISYIKKIRGKEIDVEVKQQKLLNTSKAEWGRHIAIIRSHDELKEIYVQEHTEFNEDKDYSDFYNKEHFNDNVVIMLFNTLAYGGDQFSIEKVTKSSGKMQIYLKQKTSTDMTYASFLRTFISVSKQELEGIKSVVVYEDIYNLYG